MKTDINRDAARGGTFKESENPKWRPYWAEDDVPWKEPEPPKDWPGGTGREVAVR